MGSPNRPIDQRGVIGGSLKFNDAVWGAALLMFAAALGWHVRSFPNIPGQSVGPYALPGALAVGLGVCGAILLVRGLRQRRAGSPPGWLTLPLWFGSRRQVIGFAVLVCVNALYLLAADRLGFIVVGTVYLTALMVVLRVPPWRALLIGALMTLLIHAVFYKLLKVPLPWGLLQPVAW
ncbi:MAG: tripartite tricarboxylate transporter TctB family protein [Rubrivivax sp.]